MIANQSMHGTGDKFLCPASLPKCIGAAIGTPLRGTKMAKWKLNLPLANRYQLQELGVQGENILDADICTSCASDRFYSHRKGGGTTGRLLNFIMLNDNIL